VERKFFYDKNFLSTAIYKDSKASISPKEDTENSKFSVHDSPPYSNPSSSIKL